jgi:outer membrane receptor protein involved in Fe transport
MPQPLSPLDAGRGPRRWLLASAAGAALLGVLGAATIARAADAAAAAPAADEGGGTTIEAVTVTARKKQERLIDVPVAAQVLSPETIARYDTTDLISLNTITTGVLIQRTGGGTPGATIYIRGIGVFGTDYASEQPVSVVIDGIPITRGHIVDAGFFDQSDIQILKGPQSLFYGKNSPAGVVAINSNSPGDHLSGYLKASYGFNSQDPELEGAISVPITDTLAIRLALRAEDMQGGYVTNQAKPLAVDPVTDPFFGGQPVALAGANYKTYPQTKELVERFTAVWKPTPRFDATFKLLGSYYHNDSSTGNDGFPSCQVGGHPYYIAALGGVYQDSGATCPSTSSNDGTVPAPVLNHFIGAPSNGQYYTLTQNLLGSIQLNYRLPYVTLTSVSGFYKVKADEFGNYDSTVFAETPDYQSESTTVYTQEFRAATTFNGPVNFTAGGFYEHERRYLYNTNRIFLLGPLPAGLTGQGGYAGSSNSMIGYDSNGSEDFSFFGSFDWKILPKLELSGGGRWTDAHKKSSLTQLQQALDQLYGPYAIAQQFSTLTPAGTVYNIETRYQNFSPEATLSYHISHDLMVYAAYKTGFLAGGIANPGVVTNYLVYTKGVFDPAATQALVQSNLTFAPEKVKGEEIGIKGTVFDGKLSGDLTLFHYTYYDLQVATFHANTTTFSIGNAGSAIDQGVEANLNYAISPELSVRTSITYVPLRYSSFPNSQCFSGETVAQGCVNGFQNLSHQDFGGPPLSMNFGGTWTHELNEKYSLSLNGDVEVYDATPLVNAAPGTSTPGHAVANLTARYYQTHGPWSFNLVATNINDDRTLYITGAKPLGYPGDLWGGIPPGREIRLQAEYRF